MRLAAFINLKCELIVRHWENKVKRIIGGDDLPSWVLRDHAPAILSLLATSLTMSPRLVEQESERDSKENAAVTDQHVLLRIESGLDLAQIIDEYQALRNSVIELWRSLDPAGFCDGATEIASFCAAVDEDIREAVLYYKNREAQYRDRFLGIIGHELRNPVNSIVLGATALSNQDLPVPASATVARVLTSARRLATMLGDFLDFSRGRLKMPLSIVPVETDLRILVNEVIDEITLTHPECRIELFYEGNIKGRWDPDRLRRLIYNLVLNAIQHGGGDRVEIEAKGDGTLVTLVIHNQGPIIPPEMLAGLFDPLVRGTHGNKPGTGLGLGLFIVKQIAAAHSGLVTVSSSEKDGTAFTVTLPRSVDKD